MSSTALSYWWEVASLFQKTLLTGWLLLIHNDMKFLRLLIALAITVAFLVMMLECQPYKRMSDRALATGSQLLFVNTFICGIVVRRSLPPLTCSVVSHSHASPSTFSHFPSPCPALLSLFDSLSLACTLPLRLSLPPTHLNSLSLFLSHSPPLTLMRPRRPSPPFPSLALALLLILPLPLPPSLSREVSIMCSLYTGTTRTYHVAILHSSMLLTIS